jgi:hypothetical protein
VEFVAANHTRDGRHLRVLLIRGLGLLWLVSGLLQAQPAQFRQGVMTNVLAPLVERQPQWFQHGLLALDQVWASHLEAANAALVVSEVAIGALLLLMRPSGRIRTILWLSIVGSVALWYFAEGLGGLLTGYASTIYEFPGVAFLYGALAVAALLPDRFYENGALRRGLKVSIGIMWLMGAILQALPAAAFWNGPRLGGLFGDVTMTGLEPPFLAQITNAAVTVTTFHPLMSNLVLVLILAALGVGWLWRPDSAVVRTATWIWLAFLWVVPEGFGLLFSGYAANLGMSVPTALAVWISGGSSPSRTSAGAGAPRTAGDGQLQ